jgi:aryl carrier-like protein
MLVGDWITSAERWRNNSVDEDLSDGYQSVDSNRWEQLLNTNVECLFKTSI